MLTIIALAVAMMFLRPVLVPFTLALFAAIVLSPLVNWLVVNGRIPKWLALLVAMLLGILIFLGLGAIVTTSIAGLTANREAYKQRIVQIGDQLTDTVNHWGGPWLERFLETEIDPSPSEIDPPAIGPPAEGAGNGSPAVEAATAGGAVEVTGEAPSATELAESSASASVQQAPRIDLSRLTREFSHQIGGFVQSGLLDLGSAILSLVSDGVLVLIFLFFLMAGSLTNTAQATGFWGEVETRVKNYLVMKVVCSAMTGVGTGLVLALLGVDLAMTFGVLAFALNFIPNIGSVIAMLLPLPIVILAPDATLWTVVLAVALPGAVQMTVGNLIEPKWMGDSLDLHPVVILMALIFFGMIWGIVGMLLATPIAAIIKIVLDRLDVTRPFAELMAGRMMADGPVAPLPRQPLGGRLFGALSTRRARQGRRILRRKMKRFGPPGQ